MTRALNIEKAVIFYDTTDQNNRGWAYNLITDDEHLSGALDSTSEDAPLETLLSELHAAGYREIPSEGWRRADDGNGWVRSF